MKIDPRCFPCALRRILCTAERITDDAWLHYKLLGKAMAELPGMERTMTPAEMMHSMAELTSKTLGTQDPYQKVRERWYQELEGWGGKIEARVADSKEPLKEALLMAARANVFDDEMLSRSSLREELGRLGLREPASEKTKSEPEEFAFSDYDLFIADLEKSRRLLFLHDSGPELPFDRVLIMSLLAHGENLQVTCVVRQQRVLMDATREDLDRFDILDIPGVVGAVDPGISALGIPISECSREFREVFDASDLILAKGQAHLETLADCGKTAYFLLRAKCVVMAAAQGVEIGNLILTKP
ncbi:MAG: ARMT1-like domain-containing protein [Planctomycetota bacterium]